MGCEPSVTSTVFSGAVNSLIPTDTPPSADDELEKVSLSDESEVKEKPRIEPDETGSEEKEEEKEPIQSASELLGGESEVQKVERAWFYIMLMLIFSGMRIQLRKVVATLWVLKPFIRATQILREPLSLPQDHLQDFNPTIAGIDSVPSCGELSVSSDEENSEGNPFPGFTPENVNEETNETSSERHNPIPEVGADNTPDTGGGGDENNGSLMPAADDFRRQDESYLDNNYPTLVDEGGNAHGWFEESNSWNEEESLPSTISFVVIFEDPNEVPFCDTLQLESSEYGK